jgi:cytochrome c-type biogenesis protein CcmH
MTPVASLASAWPFLLVTLALVAGFSASLYWAVAAGNTAMRRGRTLALVLIAPLAVGLLYAARGEPRALAAAEPHPAVDMLAAIDRLAERLKEHPDDVNGWLMLIRSYQQLGRYTAASEAYEHVAAQAMQEPELLVNWIDTRLIVADRHFDARTFELVERARALAPNDSDVLALSALAELERGDFKSATATLKTLREHYQPGTPDRKEIDAALEKLQQGKDPRIAPDSAK